MIERNGTTVSLSDTIPRESAQNAEASSRTDVKSRLQDRGLSSIDFVKSPDTDHVKRQDTKAIVGRAFLACLPVKGTANIVSHSKPKVINRDNRENI